MKLIGTGWKSPSLIDVHNKVTFTLWLCGCNLKCPFCHNWKIAEKIGCGELDINRLLDELDSASLLIDYLHVTGGEPLLQWEPLLELFKTSYENYNVENSLNTNFTLTIPLKKHLDSGYVHHVATDLKVPPNEMYGVENWKALWESYLKSLSLMKEYDIPLELRIPVSRFPWEEKKPYIDQALKALGDANFYVIINPLLNYPVVNPRNKEWCDKHCSPQKEELNIIKDYLESQGIKVYLKGHSELI